MPVNIINNMTIHDRAEYDAYLRVCMGVFRKFNGSILAAQDVIGKEIHGSGEECQPSL